MALYAAAPAATTTSFVLKSVLAISAVALRMTASMHCQPCFYMLVAHLLLHQHLCIFEAHRRLLSCAPASQFHLNVPAGNAKRMIVIAQIVLTVWPPPPYPIGGDVLVLWCFLQLSTNAEVDT